MHFPYLQEIDMAYRALSWAMLPMMFATLAGCAAPSMAQDNSAAVPAAIIFGSCPQKPVYPEAALREKREGAVHLEFHIDADGTMLETKVARSSGHADLDEAARVGLAKCKFKAATHNGNPVREWAQINYVWQI